MGSEMCIRDRIRSACDLIGRRRMLPSPVTCVNRHRLIHQGTTAMLCAIVFECQAPLLSCRRNVNAYRNTAGVSAAAMCLSE